MKISFLIKRIVNNFNLNLVIYGFLIYTVLKFTIISIDLNVQLINALICFGIYFILEDKKLNINHNKTQLCSGIFIFLLNFFRSFFLYGPDDKYYYLMLPIGIFSLVLISNFGDKKVLFNPIFLISILLPLRRVFFYIFNPLLLPLTKYLTWLSLSLLGIEGIIKDYSIHINDVTLVISNGCAGTNNLFFSISTFLIYSFIFRLREKNNFNKVAIFTIIFPIFINLFRNTFLGYVITLDNIFKDDIFYLFHDSIGSLFFDLITLFVMSKFYFRLLNKELKN